MEQCNICHKPIKGVQLFIKGVIYDVNVCAKCLKPYTKEGENKKVIDVIYKKITKKKK